MLGVVENMAGLVVPARALRFTAPDGRGGSNDMTAAATAALAAVAPGLVATADVFAATGGGAERARPRPPGHEGALLFIATLCAPECRDRSGCGRPRWLQTSRRRVCSVVMGTLAAHGLERSGVRA